MTRQQLSQIEPTQQDPLLPNLRTIGEFSLALGNSTRMAFERRDWYRNCMNLLIYSSKKSALPYARCAWRLAMADINTPASPD